MIELFFLLFAGSLLAATGDAEDDDKSNNGSDVNGDEDLAATVIRGSEGADTINGTSDDERVFGFGQDDYIEGKGGDDILNGDEGDDRVLGGAGDDVLRGGNGDDELTGGEGDDLIVGGDGNDTLNARGGSDTMYGMEGNDFFRISGGSQAYGGEGRDYFEVDAFVTDADVDGAFVSGGSGDDNFMFVENKSSSRVEVPIELTANGGEGDDSFEFHTHGVTVSGGEGADSFTVVQRAPDAGQELSTITDFDPAEGDQLVLQYDSEILTAESLSEFLTFRDDGGDSILSFKGDDIVRLQGRAGQVGLNDIAIEAAGTTSGGFPSGSGELVAGSDGDDPFLAGGGVVIMGFGGDDVITHTGGSSGEVGSFGFFNAGEGDDTVTVEGDYVQGTLGAGDDMVTIDVAASSQVSGSEFRTETMRINGGDGNDTMVGGSGNDRLDGEEGDDFIVSGGGTDILLGGAGADTISMAGDGTAFLGRDEDEDILRVVDTAARLEGDVNRFVANRFFPADDVLVFELPAGTAVPVVAVSSFDNGPGPGGFDNVVTLDGVEVAFIYSYGAPISLAAIQFVEVGAV